MKLKNVVFILAALLIELAIMGPFLSIYFLSILTAVVLYLALEVKIEEALILTFSLGFIVDICSFHQFPIMTIFLLVELGVVYLSKRKFVDLRNPAAIFLFLASFSIARLILELFLYRAYSNDISIIYSALANILLAFTSSIIISRLISIKKANAEK